MGSDTHQEKSRESGDKGASLDIHFGLWLSCCESEP